MQISLTSREAAEKLFFVLMLFVLSGSLFPFNMSDYSIGGWKALETSSIHYFWFVLGGFYSITGLLLLSRWQQALRVVRSCPWIVLLLLFACLSILWSTAPELTLRRAVAFLGTNMLGFYLVARFSLKETLSLLAVSFWLVMIFSVILVVFFPEYGLNPAPHEGAWRGVFSQKQAAGVYFSLAFLVFLVNASFGSGTRLSTSLAGMACSSLLIHQTNSRTALVLLLLTAAAFVFFAFLVPGERRKRSLWVVVAFVVVARLLWGGITWSSSLME